MNPQPGQREQQPPDESWIAWPFAEQVLSLIALVGLAPGALALYLTLRGVHVLGLVLLLVWAVLVRQLLLRLDRNRRVRLQVSVPCVLAFMLVCSVAMLKP